MFYICQEGFDRLRAAIEAGDEPDTAARLYNCGLRYRDFALGNRHLHAIMFQDAIPRGRESAKVGEHAAAAFGALVRTVELAAAAGVLAAPDASEAARQIWSAVHGFGVCDHRHVRLLAAKPSPLGAPDWKPIGFSVL